MDFAANSSEESGPTTSRLPESTRRVVGRSGVRGEGPFIDIFLEVVGKQVRAASFETYGCPSALRCGDWLTKWAVGRELHFLTVIEPTDLERVVGGLPLGKEFCASMAVEALHAALMAYDLEQEVNQEKGYKPSLEP